MESIINKVFYFIRHAQTDANAQELMCGGGWDIPLNKTGIEQIQQAKISFNMIKDELCSFYISPMIRTQMTAELLNESHSFPIENIEGLREWKVGDWEKRPWKEVPNPFNTTVDPPNGETRSEFEERVVSSVNSVLEKIESKAPLFVSHGAVAHTLFTFMGVDTPTIKNATLYKLSPIDRRWCLEEVLTNTF